MYGTIARLRLKPGSEQKMAQMSEEDAPEIKGFAFQYLYRTDADPNVVYLVVGFESKEAYQANAASAEQHQRYQRYRELLETDPEWHDGEIIFSNAR